MFWFYEVIIKTYFSTRVWLLLSKMCLMKLWILGLCYHLCREVYISHREYWITSINSYASRDIVTQEKKNLLLDFHVYYSHSGKPINVSVWSLESVQQLARSRHWNTFVVSALLMYVVRSFLGEEKKKYNCFPFWWPEVFTYLVPTLIWLICATFASDIHGSHMMIRGDFGNLLTSPPPPLPPTMRFTFTVLNNMS